MMNYLIFGIVIATVAYYLARKYYLMAIDIYLCKEAEQKEMENKLEEKNKITQLSHIKPNSF